MAAGLRKGEGRGASEISDLATVSSWGGGHFTAHLQPRAGWPSGDLAKPHNRGSIIFLVAGRQQQKSRNLSAWSGEEVGGEWQLPVVVAVGCICHSVHCITALCSLVWSWTYYNCPWQQKNIFFIFTFLMLEAETSRLRGGPLSEVSK